MTEPPNKPAGPADEYRSRLRRRREAEAALARRSAWLSVIRFAVFVVALLAGWGGYAIGGWGVLLVVPPLAVFIYLIAVHERIVQARARAARGAEFYARGLDRLNDAWAGKGKSGIEYFDADHPYARDLDLFGKGSLFELVCAARTRAGEQRLASWLLEQADPAEMRARQAAVEELRPRVDLREDIAALAAEVRRSSKPEDLEAWARAPVRLSGAAPRLAALLLAVLGIAGLVGWAWLGWGPAPFLAFVLADALFLRVYRDRINAAYEGASRVAGDLGVLAELLARFEQESFSSARLLDLRRRFETEGMPASRQIARLRRYVDWLDDAKRNQVFAPVAFILMVPLQLAFAVERWRGAIGARLPDWIEAVAELEALLSIAGYAYEHPHDVFAEIEEGPMRYEAEALGHPLIPESRCIRNDTSFGDKPRLIMLSGSNMSGKSTFMRTVGINAVLALAGAPARARRLVISPLVVGASIQNVDSLQGGASRFYAEISRIKQVVSLGEGERPVLFLMDEILSGTNPRDRRIGAEAVVKQLMSRNAFGIITTHDLELTQVADRLGDAAVNLHFEDRLEEGKIVFDYKLRTGVVRQGNALELMRAVGLEV